MRRAQQLTGKLTGKVDGHAAVFILDGHCIGINNLDFEFCLVQLIHIGLVIEAKRRQWFIYGHEKSSGLGLSSNTLQDACMATHHRSRHLANG